MAKKLDIIQHALDQRRLQMNLAQQTQTHDKGACSHNEEQHLHQLEEKLDNEVKQDQILNEGIGRLIDAGN